MRGCTKVLIFILNVVVLLFSIRHILFVRNLHCQSQTVFFTTLNEKDIGIIFSVISIVGIVALFCNFTILSRIYLVVLLVLIIILSAFLVFGFFITKGGSGEGIQGKAYNEYRLQSYSVALRVRVAASWNSTKTCLVDRKICNSLIDLRNVNLGQFNSMRLSPLQSGCCKPSNDCGFIFVTPINWTKPANIDATANTTSNDDCGVWSNDKRELCYDWDACKAGMVQSIKDTWRKGAIIKMVIGGFLLIVFVVGCCALPWNKEIEAEGHEVRIYEGCCPSLLSAIRCGFCPGSCC